MSIAGTSAIASVQPSTTAISCSRRPPSGGGIGAGCSRLMKAAPNRSLALEKCAIERGPGDVGTTR